MLPKAKPALRRAGILIILIISVLNICIGWALCVDNTWAQQPVAPSVLPQSQVPVSNGSGYYFLSQYADPALRGALYLTPDWPLSGYYPLYPGGLSQVIPDDRLLVGPLKLHPFMGVAQMYTDNVFRTNTNRTSDFLTTLSPGIQAQLPFAGSHAFLIDYRTNIQYYSRTPSNDVQDQTASGGFKFDFPGGLKVDLQGEHKLGHDPRGSAVDTQNLDVNKWTANSFNGQVQYDGARSGVRLNMQSTRWNFLNNNQGISRDSLNNYVGLTFFGDVTGKTSVLTTVSAFQQIYDQNKNLDNVMYQVSGGPTWRPSELISGQILVGYQYLQYTLAQVNQPPPLSQFTRSKDSFQNFFFMGILDWAPTSLLTIRMQPYRTIQQTVVFGNLFYTVTGVNLGASHTLTDNTTLTLNLGLEQDQFESASGSTSGGDRTDFLKNVAVGVKYRAVKWVGLGFQYIFEDRSSNQNQFDYHANTFMVSAQTLF